MCYPDKEEGPSVEEGRGAAQDREEILGEEDQ